MFKRGFSGLAIALAIGIFIGGGLGLHLNSKTKDKVRSLEAHIASVEQSKAKVLRMYTQAQEELSTVRLNASKAIKELNETIQLDEASRDWGSQRIPDGVRNALRSR